MHNVVTGVGAQVIKNKTLRTVVESAKLIQQMAHLPLATVSSLTEPMIMLTRVGWEDGPVVAKEIFRALGKETVRSFDRTTRAIQRGTGKRIADLKIPLAGKTGTTNDNKDAWFIGFSPDLVVGIYVGYDNPKSLGYKETGAKVAVPIFKDFMSQALSNKNKIPFRVPSGISFVNIDLQTGLQTDSKDGIMESYIIGTEPFIKKALVLDSLGSFTTDTLSGTGNLLIN